MALAGQGKTRGTVAITEIELCTNQSLAAIVTNSSVDDDCLRFYLENQYQNLREISSGDGTRGGLNLTLINEYNVSLPSINEQKKIAIFLTYLEQRINKQRQLVELLKSYKRGALNQFFSKITQRVPLSEISEYYSSANTMASITQVENGKYPIYDASGIVALIDEYDFANTYVAIIKDGSGVGRLQLCQSKSSIIGTLGAIFPKHCTVAYLFAVLQTIDFRQFTTGMAIPHIYYKDYKNCLIPFPPQEQRNKIERVLTAIDFMIDKESRILSLLRQQKTSLMQQLFI